MIPRYSRPKMAAIWEPENRFRIWFEIEAQACDAQAELGVIPKEAARAGWLLPAQTTWWAVVALALFTFVRLTAMDFIYFQF